MGWLFCWLFLHEGHRGGIKVPQVAASGWPECVWNSSSSHLSVMSPAYESVIPISSIFSLVCATESGCACASMQEDLKAAQTARDREAKQMAQLERTRQRNPSDRQIIVSFALIVAQRKCNSNGELTPVVAERLRQSGSGVHIQYLLFPWPRLSVSGGSRRTCGGLWTGTRTVSSSSQALYTNMFVCSFFLNFKRRFYWRPTGSWLWVAITSVSSSCLLSGRRDKIAASVEHGSEWNATE